MSTDYEYLFEEMKTSYQDGYDTAKALYEARITELEAQLAAAQMPAELEWPEPPRLPSVEATMGAVQIRPEFAVEPDGDD